MLAIKFGLSIINWQVVGLRGIIRRSSVFVLNDHEMGGHYELAVGKPTTLAVDKAIGVVFLLGWTGCVDKPLAKYSAIYQNMGFTVIRFSPSFSALFSPRSAISCRKHARKMMDFMFQEDIEGKPVFIHAFSNGGSSLMRLLLDEFDGDSKAYKGCLRGLILDSAPTPITFVSAYRVVMSIFPRFFGSRIVAPIVATILCPYLHFCYYFNRLCDWFKGERDTEHWRFLVWDSLSRQTVCLCPQLCLYSKADGITKPEYVEMFAEERIKRGVKVELHPFQDSRHIGHLTKYAEEYESAVRNFVRETLN